MSALEQIRKRPVLIISILGLALLLFILTAISNPERLFSDPSTIAKVDGEKIDFKQFQERYQAMIKNDEQRAKANNQERTDGAILEMQAMESIINEVLMTKKLEELGIEVTDNEISDVINAPMPHRIVSQYLQSLGIPTAVDFYNYAFEPANNGIDPQSAEMLSNYWMQMENDLRQQLLNDKFQMIFGYSLVPNNVEALGFFNDSQTIDTIRYVRLTPSVITDAEANLTPSDINAVYNKEKNRFAITEDQNLVNYIKVNIVPSEADRAKAFDEVEMALNNLREMPGTEGVYSNLDFIVENYNTSADRLPAAIAARISQLEEDSVMQISFANNEFTLAKLLGTGSANDKAKIDMFVVAENADVDSVITLLASGVEADSLKTLIAQSVRDQEVSLLDPNMIEVASIFDNATVGEYFAPAADERFPGNIIYCVTSKEEPVATYNVAEIKYRLEPSNATVNDLRDKLSTYINRHSSAAEFVDSAAAAGYTVVPTHIGKSSLSINGIPESRTLAKWSADKDNNGHVSEIITDGSSTYFMAVAVSDVYDDGFLPASDPLVKEYITPIAMTQKKLDILSKQYADKGATLEAFAEATNLPIETAAVSFSGQINNILSADGKLLGLVAATPLNGYVAPTATSNAVIAFEKVGTQAPAREFIKDIDMSEFIRTMGHPLSSPYNVPAILRHGKEVDNRIQNFSND